MSQSDNAMIDHELSSSLSALVDKRSLSLAQLIRLWRDESPTDMRSNKALDTEWLDILLHKYQHKNHVIAIARHGVEHSFEHVRPPDATPVKNHRSAIQYGAALDRSVAEGQANGTYLVIDSSTTHRWRILRYSPFGCVPKKDADPLVEARLIHDLSHPDRESTNACSLQAAFPSLDFVSIRKLAERIEALTTAHLHAVIKILKGDVKGAYRHVPVSSLVAQFFIGTDTVGRSVIDLSLPFGWTGSPAIYGAFGGAISYLVARESPNSLSPFTASDTESFFSYVWVDDHVLVEIDRGDRLMLAEAALRLSTLAVLGPRAINDKKFSSWDTRLCALGLIWDTKDRSVSMPADKIEKAVGRLCQVIT